jgi:hypothetical protein
VWSRLWGGQVGNREFGHPRCRAAGICRRK